MGRGSAEGPAPGASPLEGVDVPGLPPVSFVVVGGNPAERRGLTAILSERGATPVEDPDEARVVVAAHSPGELVRARPEGVSGVLVATVHGVSALRAAAVARYDGVADAAGPSASIVLAIHAALQGHWVVPSEVLRRLLVGVPAPNGELDPEALVRLNRLAAGWSVLRLAESESVSERAMYRRLADTYRSIGARSRSEAIARVASAGLIRHLDLCIA